MHKLNFNLSAFVLSCLKYLLLFSFLISLQSCKDESHIKPVATSWYFWKTKFTASDLQLVSQMTKTEPVYIRIFDIVWDKNKNKPRPHAPLQYDTLPLNWIPVIYIKNEIFYPIDSAKVDTLSSNILKLMQHQIPYEGWNRLQIDCDWTEGTRDKYFWFLECMKVKLGKELSSTIRLHQINSTSKMGIPPVSHGVLMCYNMQSPVKQNTKNSIYTLELLKAYTLKAGRYPIQLDIAFPLYTWAVVFRRNKFYTLINEVRETDMNPDFFSHTKDNWHKVNEPTLLRGFALLENDEIRIEETSEKDLDEGIQLLLGKINRPVKLIWYHLDSSVIENRKELVNDYNH